MGRPGCYVRAYIVLSQRGFDIFVREKEESKNVRNAARKKYYWKKGFRGKEEDERGECSRIEKMYRIA